MKRRDFCNAGIAGLAGGIAGCNTNTEKPVEIPKVQNETPQTYGIQYYDIVSGMWDRISTSELPIIVQAADKAAASLKNGKKLYCQLIGGHMLAAEIRPGRSGNPNYLHNWPFLTKEEEFLIVP